MKLFGHVARTVKSQDHSRALQACISPAPRNWRRHPGRPRHTWLRWWKICTLVLVCVRASESTKQNNLADTHRNRNVTDKLRLMMMTIGEAGFSIARLCTHVRVYMCMCVCVCNNFVALRRDPCCPSTLVVKLIVNILSVPSTGEILTGHTQKVR